MVLPNSSQVTQRFQVPHKFHGVSKSLTCFTMLPSPSHISLGFQVPHTFHSASKSLKHFTRLPSPSHISLGFQVPHKFHVAPKSLKKHSTSFVPYGCIILEFNSKTYQAIIYFSIQHFSWQFTTTSTLDFWRLAPLTTTQSKGGFIWSKLPGTQRMLNGHNIMNPQIQHIVTK
jgi:hypothetical protein